MAAFRSSEYLDRPKYRSDIDGLRAVAVLGVIGFHAFPSQIAGGFVGVDIFFVISGFLISTLIFNGLAENHFSFIEFYTRRIRRIFPALLLVLITTYVVGWFALFPLEYAQVGKHVVGGAAFISNFLYWIESGYFDNSSVTKPLLHLWSLGVEEQFYIVWPLVLWLAWRRDANILLIAALVGAASFAMSITDINSDPIAAFYSPLARFWELMLGAILARLASQPSLAFTHLEGWLGTLSEKTVGGAALRNVISFAGIAFITASVFVISERSKFPGWWAPLPTVGTAMIIYAGPQAWLNRTVLAHRVMVWLGLISYPLYLWHWPLLSYAHILDCETPAFAIRVALVAASVAFAWLTYKIVEKPIRFGQRGLAKAVALLASMFVIVSIGTYTYWTDGLPFRAVSNRNGVSELLHYGFRRPSDEVAFWKGSCFLIDVSYKSYAKNGCDVERFANRPKVFFIGDSFSGFLGLGLRNYLLDRKYNLFQFSAASCTPLSLKDHDARCRAIARYILDEIATQKPEIVIIFASYAAWQTLPQYGEEVPYDGFVLQKTIEIRNMGVKKIYLVGENTLWKDYLPKILARKFLLEGKKIPPRTAVGVDPMSFAWNEKMRGQPYPDNVTYIPLMDYLCDKSRQCLAIVGPDLKHDLISFDAGHLTEAGAQYITAHILSKYID